MKPWCGSPLATFEPPGVQVLRCRTDDNALIVVGSLARLPSRNLLTEGANLGFDAFWDSWARSMGIELFGGGAPLEASRYEDSVTIPIIELRGQNAFGASST
jgi:hypothetical protein